MSSLQSTEQHTASKGNSFKIQHNLQQRRAFRKLKPKANLLSYLYYYNQTTHKMTNMQHKTERTTITIKFSNTKKLVKRLILILTKDHELITILSEIREFTNAFHAPLVLHFGWLQHHPQNCIHKTRQWTANFGSFTKIAGTARIRSSHDADVCHMETPRYCSILFVQTLHFQSLIIIMMRLVGLLGD